MRLPGAPCAYVAVTANVFLIRGRNDRKIYCPPARIIRNEIITYFRVFYDVGAVKICITRLNNFPRIQGVTKAT